MINRLLAKLIAFLPENLVWVFSKRYIAGKRLDDAVKVTEDLNSKGITATIDVLGEYIKQTDEAIEYKDNYLKSIDVIKKQGLQTTISIKPSMFGLLLDEEFCYKQLHEVISKAKKNDLLVCMDMEDSSCTQIELNLFERLYKEFPGTITLVLQAYLRRTLDDLKWLKSIMLPDYPINVRICKGIYVEPEEVAFQKYKEVNENFIKCVEYMLDNDFYTAIATHDKRLVTAINKILKDKQTDSSKYEYQMLYGVRPNLRDRLVRQKHMMRIYVPYGTHWYGYSTRRLKENPRMIPHIMKALIFRG
jgi:proline dehydrogenase